MCTAWIDGANGVERSSADYRKNPTSKRAAGVLFNAMRLEFFPTNLFSVESPNSYVSDSQIGAPRSVEPTVDAVKSVRQSLAPNSREQPSRVER
jgi:hypothetical protein